MVVTEPLNPLQEGVWRALARLVVVLPRAMTADLQGQCGLSLTEYSVLLHLSESSDHKLRMSDLADLLLVSQAQTTRLVQDMERQGLVSRSRSATDGRSTVAALTAEGMETLQAAWPTHLDGARRLVVDHLPADSMPELQAALEAMIAACAEGQR